jgi:hypothetical protein
MDNLIKMIIPSSLNSFWTANFWGILGTVTGVTGVIVSWLNFKYSKPQIEIEELQLEVPSWAKNWEGKSIEELKSRYIDFELEIILRNKKGGQGSIDKPNLILNFPDKKQKNIILKPITEHNEYERESDSVLKISTIKHGRTYYLNGGQKIDDNLRYDCRNPQDIHDYIQYYSNIKYLIEYKDNFGKKYNTKIKKIVDKT